MNCAGSTPPCVSSSACDEHRARVLRLAHRSARALHQRKPFVIVIHGTRTFRDRVRGPAVTPGETSTTVLGAWYATVLRWRRPAALFVNKRTLLPLVMPLAPARTLLTRFPDALAGLLSAHRVPAALIDSEHAEASDHRLAPTANRSLVGVMNEFASLADVDRGGPADLMRVFMRLATTPCGPLFQRHISPDRVLAALIADLQAEHMTCPRPDETL